MTTETLNTLQLTRRFKAPRRRVFDAFSTFDALKLWLGPDPCTVVGGEVNFRVGGSYRAEVQPNRSGGCATDSRGLVIVVGTYREIKPPERIVFTWRWLNDDEAPETVVTIELEASGQETVLSLTQSGFASDDSRDRHEHGWTGSFDKLAALVGAA